MARGKRTIINVICSVLVLFTNLAISFFLSPYIVKHIGVEANGFVTLANNFITYANLIVTALNSMAARYIAIEYVREDYKKANLYYNSVFWGNLIIDAVLLIPALCIIIYMENIFDVPANILLDVKLLFGFMFFNFFLTTGFPNWDCGVFVKNRLDRQYIPNIIISVLKCVFMFGMLTIFVPHVWYIGLSATLATVSILAVNGYNTHKLTPELKVRLKKGERMCSKKAVWELVGTGIWNSISNIGNMLLSGLDLIISNVALGATAMGLISLSKTIPNYMQHLSASIRQAFVPELVINYAKNDLEAIKKDLDRAMKLTSIVMTVPIACVVVLGKEFFSLWVPSQDAGLLQILSVLAIVGYMFTSGTQILFNVFSTVKKVKQNSIAMLISGVVSTTITLLFVNFTDYGIFAVAGVSSFVNLIRNMTFTVPATARYLGFKWYQFFPQVISTVVSSLVIIGMGFAVKFFLPAGSWITFIFSAGVVAIIGLAFNIMIILNKSDRSYLFEMVKRKVRRK